MRIHSKKRTFRALGLIPACLLVAVGYWIYLEHFTPEEQGKNLNRRAWEASFVERGLAVPESGPREGYWGARLGAKTPHPRLGWHEPQSHVEGLLAIDEQGHQQDGPVEAADLRVLILGGSVAFGAYASSLDTVYYRVLGKALAGRGMRAHITVIASGAWKSAQELAALRIHGPELRPDQVVFLNGLNDLTSGARADTLEGERTETRNGSIWTPGYHEHDYAERVEAYLINMQAAARWASAKQARLLVVLQPALSERRTPTPIERMLLQRSMARHASGEALLGAYAQMRTGLEKLARRPHVDFMDASRVFHAESATTFSDLWHFSDPGHQILANAMAARLSESLSDTMPPAE